MDREQAKNEYEKIVRESNKKTISIIEEAKKNGTWKQGLDSNKDLFAELEKETRKKIEELIEKIE